VIGKMPALERNSMAYRDAQYPLTASVSERCAITASGY